jgi:hypothetical protein
LQLRCSRHLLLRPNCLPVSLACLPSCSLQEFTAITSNRYLHDGRKRYLMRDALLSDRTLAEVRRERLNYTQLLYR